MSFISVKIAWDGIINIATSSELQDRKISLQLDLRECIQPELFGDVVPAVGVLKGEVELVL